MTLIDTFDVCIFLGREANRLCIGARKSANNNICVIMNVLSLVFIQNLLIRTASFELSSL